MDPLAFLTHCYATLVYRERLRRGDVYWQFAFSCVDFGPGRWVLDSFGFDNSRVDVSGLLGHCARSTSATYPCRTTSKLRRQATEPVARSGSWRSPSTVAWARDDSRRVIWRKDAAS